MTLCTNHCGQEIIEAIIKALAPACPDRAMAGWGRRFRIAIQGADPRTRQAVHLALFQARPGGGASSAGDGWPGARRVAGGRRHQVRQHRGAPRCAFRCSSAATSSGPDRGGDGQLSRRAGRRARDGRRDRPSPRSAIPPATACSYGACGMLGGADGKPHRYVLHSTGRRIARSRPRRSASRSGPATCSHVAFGRRRRLGRSGAARARRRARGLPCWAS